MTCKACSISSLALNIKCLFHPVLSFGDVAHASYPPAASRSVAVTVLTRYVTQPKSHQRVGGGVRVFGDVPGIGLDGHLKDEVAWAGLLGGDALSQAPAGTVLPPASPASVGSHLPTRGRMRSSVARTACEQRGEEGTAPRFSAPEAPEVPAAAAPGPGSAPPSGCCAPLTFPRAGSREPALTNGVLAPSAEGGVLVGRRQRRDRGRKELGTACWGQGVRHLGRTVPGRRLRLPRGFSRGSRSLWSRNVT